MDQKNLDFLFWHFFFCQNQIFKEILPGNQGLTHDYLCSNAYVGSWKWNCRTVLLFSIFLLMFYQSRIPEWEWSWIEPSFFQTSFIWPCVMCYFTISVSSSVKPECLLFLLNSIVSGKSGKDVKHPVEFLVHKNPPTCYLLLWLT